MSQSNYPALERTYPSYPQGTEDQQRSPYQGDADSRSVDWRSIQSQLPLPSQLLDAKHLMKPPPSQIPSESIFAANPTFLGPGDQYSHQAQQRDPNFAKRANELINEAVGREPGGTSVVEPDSILEESGRLYHGYREGKYWAPNDAAEQDRLDLQHQIYLMLLDGWLHLAPMDIVPKYVLDVATGTGIWAHDFAEKYPSSFVIGTDLSAIQPAPRAPNVAFQKDDAESPWVFPAPHPPDASCVSPCTHSILFDYVHLRLVVTCFDDTRYVMRQAFENMKPGGWIEYQDMLFDIQDAHPEESPLRKYCEGCRRGAASMGRDLMIPTKYKEYLEETGFVDVQERRLFFPMSPWPQDPRLKEAGQYQLQNVLEGLRGMGWKMLKLAGYSAEEIETIVQDASEFVRDVRNCPYSTIYVVYGRKPLA